MPTPVEYKPQNWMTPPTVIEEEDGSIVVRKRAGASEDRLDIRIVEMVSDVTHDMGEAAALEKDGVEADFRSCSRTRRSGAARVFGSCAASGPPTSGRST